MGDTEGMFIGEFLLRQSQIIVIVLFFISSRLHLISCCDAELSLSRLKNFVKSCLDAAFVHVKPRFLLLAKT